MKLLLDSHIFLWARNSPEKIDPTAIAEMISPQNIVFVSLVSMWELQINASLEKIKLPDHFFDGIETKGYELLPIQIDHIKSLKQLPFLHRDPFDRMLVAQAKSEGLTLVTRDQEILKYDVPTLKG